MPYAPKTVELTKLQNSPCIKVQEKDNLTQIMPTDEVVLLVSLACVRRAIDKDIDRELMPNL